MEQTLVKIEWVEYLVIFMYLAFLMGIGYVFRKFNKNAADYFKSGSQGTWWLMGASLFMAGVSSVTFTANAGVAYRAGWSIFAVYLGGTIAGILQALIFAAWFRQMRATTFPEVVRERYSENLQQWYAITAIFFSLLAGAMMTYGISIFISGVFGWNVKVIIAVIATVVILYSTFGGRWGVMAADFVQSLVLIPVAIVVTVLCLKHPEIGGFTGFLTKIKELGLTEQYAPFKSVAYCNENLGGVFTTGWLMAMLVVGVVNGCAINMSVRYFGVKDGAEAKKTAWLQTILATGAIFFWFIPPMTARLLFSEQVQAINLPQPSEAAFAIAALNVLPAGLIGLVVVAMFSATTSSAAPLLNMNAAMVVRDVYPFVHRTIGSESRWSRKSRTIGWIVLIALTTAFWYFGYIRELELCKMFADIIILLTVPLLLLVGLPFGIGRAVEGTANKLKKPIEKDRMDVIDAQITNLVIGLAIMAMALGFSSLKETGMFDIMMLVMATVGTPMGIPMFMGMFVKRVPAWAGFFSMGCSYIPSALTMMSKKQMFGMEPWPIEKSIFWCLGVGIVAYLATMPFWKTAPQEYRERVDKFFKKMHTPINFEEEIGKGNDYMQLLMVGRLTLSVAAFMLLLVIFPAVKGNMGGVKSVIGLAVLPLAIGILMEYAGYRMRKKDETGK